MTDLPETNLVMLTLVKPEGQLEVYFERRPMPEPQEPRRCRHHFRSVHAPETQRLLLHPG